MRDYIALGVNGQNYEIRNAQAFMMLADFLRGPLGLCGTKIVCAEGDCGACTVLCQKARSPSFEPINACIAPVAELDGCHIVSIEGIKENHSLTALQQNLVNYHASQCGFCTPGFVMALSALFENNNKENLKSQDIKNYLTGNLCRCTGYQNIIDAALKLDIKKYNKISNKFNKTKLARDTVYINHKNYLLHAPNTINKALQLYAEYEGIKIIAASTDLGVAHNKRTRELSQILSLHLIDDLYELGVYNDRIRVGALVSLEKMRKFCEEYVPEFARLLNIFASPQIKHMATLVGNIANGSPIADTVPFLMVSDGILHVESLEQKRDIAMTNLYTGYKQLALKPKELITHVSFALPSKNNYLRLYKISPRKDLDIATVNMALSYENNIFKLAVGGAYERVIRLSNTEEYLNKNLLDRENIQRAQAIMQEEIKPISDLRGSEQFRRALLDSLLKRYLNEVLELSHA